METNTLSHEQVAEVLAQILDAQDPATVGVRRILRRKTTEAADFPLHVPAVQSLSTETTAKNALTDDERRIIELERQLAMLRVEMTKRHETARQAVQKAFTQGFEEGSRKGSEQAHAEASAEYDHHLSALHEKMTSVINGIEEERRNLYASADATMLALCCRIVKKILGTEPVNDKETILRVVRKALAYVSEREKIVIRVAPIDLKAVSGKHDFWMPVTERLEGITIESDERITTGGCLIESNSGIVDARLETQMQAVTDLVDEAWTNIYSDLNKHPE